jgi:hypothetical protein
MDDILGALAFALLIGGQFLAAIVVISKRDTIYANPNERVRQPVQPTGGHPEAAQTQHCIVPELALARLAQRAIAYKSDCSDEPVPTGGLIASSTRTANQATAPEDTVIRFTRDIEPHPDAARLNTPPPASRAGADRRRRRSPEAPP